MESVKKVRYCPRAFYTLLSFAIKCLNDCSISEGHFKCDADSVEFCNRGASVRDKNGCIMEYFAYSTQVNSRELSDSFKINGDRRFRLNKQQILNNVWGVR